MSAWSIVLSEILRPVCQSSKGRNPVMDSVRDNRGVHCKTKAHQIVHHREGFILEQGLNSRSCGYGEPRGGFCPDKNGGFPRGRKTSRAGAVVTIELRGNHRVLPVGLL